MDKILIKGLTVFAYHGVNPEEQEQGQHFVLDVTLTADLSRAGETDCLADTVNYAAVRKIITRVMTEQRFDLIEAAATAVAKAILAEVKQVQKVTVLLKKPEAPMNAVFDYVAVKITKEQEA